MSSTSEIQNFITKFHQLMKAGHTAHLDLDTHAGQAWVGLRVMIRPFQPQQYQHFSKKSRNPAYYRRQERRKAARKAAEASTKPSETNAEEVLVPDSMKIAEEAIVPDNAQAAEEATVSDEIEATEEIVAKDRNAERAKNPVSDIITCDTEEAKNSSNKPISHIVSFANTDRANSGGYPPIPQILCFKCDLCDFGFENERDLNSHILSKHTKIDQFDGNVSLMNLSDHKSEMKEEDEEQDSKEVKKNVTRTNNETNHTAKKYKCDLCDYSFCNKRDLKIHISKNIQELNNLM